MDKQKIYDKSPIFIQNILTSTYGLIIYRQRYGGIYKDYIKNLRKKDYSDYLKEKNIQNKEFINLLNNTVNKSVFYKNLYKDIDLDEIKTIEDMKKLPIVTKEMLRTNIKDILTIGESEGIKSQTGGTTGKSLNIVYKKSDMQKRMAYLDFYKEKHGFEKGMKRATFSGKKLIPQKDENKNIFWRYNWFLKQMMYSTFHINDNTIKYYVENLNKFKPEEIDGFITSIYEIAKYIKEHNIKLTFRPVAIFSTAETILPHHRNLVEEVFKAPVRNQYASSEGAPFITECKFGKLHYNIDTGVIEDVFIDGKKEVLVTSFTSYATPLIRYRIGDSMIFDDLSECKCGSSHKIVKEILGRSTDCLYSKERGYISSANMSNTIKGLPNTIVQIQFIQITKEYVEINLVVDEKRYIKEVDERIIENEVRVRLGDTIKLKFEYKKNIENEKSGKFRMVKNEVC